MAIGVGNLVSAADYNAIYNTVRKVLGDDGVDPQVGYGRALNSSPVSTGDVIDSTLLDALYDDLVRARTHQRGTNFSWDTPEDGINAPDTGEYIGAFAADIGATSSADATSDKAEGFLDFSQAAADILADRLSIGGDQTSIQLVHQATRTTAWNGSIVHQVDLVFANANERRYFFNSGGLIIINANLSGGNTVSGNQTATYPSSPAYQKDEIWQTMLNNMGTIYIGSNTVTATGTGSAANGGNFDLTSSYQTAFTKSGSGVYSENYYRIEAKGAQSSNKITLRITFADVDSGDDRTDPNLLPAGQGVPVDENVTGTITSTIQTRAATGALGINHPGHAVVSQLGGGGAIDSYVLTASATSISEGSSVNISLQTTNVPNGNVGYTITGITSSDLSVGSRTGNFALSSGFASLNFTLANDGVVENTETMTLTLDNGRATVSIDIVDAGAPTVSLVANPTIIDEGESATFTLTTTNTQPASYAYTITGINANDLSFGDLTGNIVTNGTTSQNSGSVSVTLANDLSTNEGIEVITFSAAGETATVQVNDTSRIQVEFPSGPYDLYSSGSSLGGYATARFTWAGSTGYLGFSGIGTQGATSGAVVNEQWLLSGNASDYFVQWDHNNPDANTEATFTDAGSGQLSADGDYEWVLTDSSNGGELNTVFGTLRLIRKSDSVVVASTTARLTADYQP